MNYFILTKGPFDKATGLVDLNLDAYQGTTYIGRIVVNSGAPGKQNPENFRTVPKEKRLQLEPIPEGEFDLGPLLWAGKPGDYTSNWFGTIQSPIWVLVYHARDIGFHLDGNRRTSPGSAGCPVFKTMNDLKKFVGWWEKYGPFSKMYVDYGLGHVNTPKPAQQKAPSGAKSAEPMTVTQAIVKKDGQETLIPAIHYGGDAYVMAKKLPAYLTVWDPDKKKAVMQEK